MTALTVIYFTAAKIGLGLAVVHPSATAVWPPTGIALTAFMLLGYRLWPGVFLGAFLANYTTAGGALTSLGIATGNTLEGLVGAFLVQRFAGGRHAFETPRGVVLFTIMAGLLSTTISATCGVTSLALGGYAEWNHYFEIWRTWWLGDVNGAIMVTPVLVLWSTESARTWSRQKMIEAFVLFLALIIFSYLVFFAQLSPHGYPLTVLCIVPLVWLSFRFDQRIVATATLLQSAIAIAGTVGGHGPFALLSKNEALLLLEFFVGMSSVTALAFTSIVNLTLRTQEKLKESEAEYRYLFEKNASPMWIVDVETSQYLAVNDAAIRHYGYTREEFLAISIKDVVVEGETSTLPLKPLEQIIVTQRHRTKSGAVIDVEVARNRISFQGKRAYAALIQDVTEKMMAERERQEVLQAKSGFIATVSHELRTPLAVIKEGLDLLMDEVVGPITTEQKNHIQITKRNVDRLARLINSVLDYQKMESGDLQFQLLPNPIHELIDETVEGFAPLAQKKGLQIVVAKEEKSPVVQCDRDKIVQVLSNLLNNAIQYSQHGTIVVKEVTENGEVRVEVHDEGVGIQKGDQPKLFHVFTQIPVDGVRRVGGTGLGLAISKKIVEGHHGRIAFQTEFGKGSTFYFTLPLYRS